MIYVYPLLVSSSVSPTFLPGICKVLERHIITYNIDDVIKRMNNSVTWGKIINTAGKLIFPIASAYAISKIGKMFGPDAAANVASKMPTNIRFPFLKFENVSEQPLPPEPDEREFRQKRKEETELRTVDIDAPNQNAIAPEPTWVKVDTAKGTRFIGVKVVPFPVKDEGKFLSVLTSEKLKAQAANQVDVMIRKATKFFWKHWTKGIDILTANPKAVTGDPVNDVIYAKTAHGDKIFTAFNMIDIGPEFIEKATEIAKLQKLGWSSFIICDDVANRVYFCLKEYKGMCSAIPYQFLFSTLGKEHAKAFENLDDVKKSSSAFFKLSVRSSKLLGESVARNSKMYYEITDY